MKLALVCPSNGLAKRVVTNRMKSMVHHDITELDPDGQRGRLKDTCHIISIPLNCSFNVALAARNRGWWGDGWINSMNFYTAGRFLIVRLDW
jgi:hypothetical protein